MFYSTITALVLASLHCAATAAVVQNRSALGVEDNTYGEWSGNLFSGFVYESSDCSGDWTLIEYNAESVWDIGCLDIAGNSVKLFWPGCGHFTGTATTHSEGGCGGSSSSVLAGEEACQSNLPFNAVQWKCNHPGPHN